MEYFYAPPGSIRGDEIVIEGEEFAHLTHVMRKRAGEDIMVVDGAGTAYAATIRSTDRRVALCAVRAVHPRLHEPEREVHLGVGVLKSTSNFDFLVEKCTELGVRSITPLATERTVVRHARSERWRKIALAAMKQSGRCVLPAVRELTRLEDFLAGADASWVKLIPHEKAEGRTIRAVLAGSLPSPVLLCIGPEGGFADGEVQSAEQRGFRQVTLGPTRLRTETAAVVAVAGCVEPP